MDLTNRQLEIIETSLAIIAEQGIQGLTIKNLSRKIGITEPAIYRHFASKTEILLTILNNFMEMASFMGTAMKDNNEGALEKIEFMFLKLTDIFSETPSFISVIFSEEVFKNDILLKTKIIEILDMNEKTIENIILQGQEKGEVRNDVNYKNLALIVMGSLRFRVKQWDLKDCRDNLQKEGAELIESLKTLLTKTN